jgi:hypothetical protein
MQNKLNNEDSILLGNHWHTDILDLGSLTDFSIPLDSVEKKSKQLYIIFKM